MSTEPQDFTDEERALFDRLNIGKAGGLPLPSFIRPSEVVAQARPLADAIFADWTALQELVTPHEALLFDRWKSLKKRKRRDLLAAAWAEAGEAVAPSSGDGTPTPTPLPLPHRPDLVAWRRREREKGQQLRESSAAMSSTSFAAPENLVTLLDWTEADRAAFLWPHLSIDDLAHKNARALWLLATSRAAVAPEAFAATDLDTTRLGKACLALLPRYLNQYSMLFSGRTSPETYGQLYTWNELEELKEGEGKRAEKGESKEDGDKKDKDDSDPGSDSFATRGTHPGEGLWILTIQARLYRFLVLAVKAVLGGAVNNSNGNGNGSVSKPAAVDDASAAAGYLDGPLRSLEGPYRAPPAAIDLQALLDIAFAKVWEAEDHVWALRTDPAYFQATLQDWAVHRKDQLAPTTSTSTSTSTAIVEPPPITSAVVDACLRRAIEQTETWNLVYAKVHLLAQQTEKHAAAVKEAVAAAAAGQPQSGDAAKLPRDVLLSFYALYYHIRSFENEPVGLLQSGAFASPPLRKHYRLEIEASDDKGGDKGGEEGGATKTKTTVAAAEGADAPPVVGDESEGHGASDPRRGQAAAVAIWALTGLQDDATRQLFGRQTLLDELETAVRVTRGEGLYAGGDHNSSSGTGEERKECPISPWVADQVATLALYARCTALLDRFQPWAAAYDQTVQQDAEIRDILTMDFHMSMGRLRALLEHALGVAPPAFVGGGGDSSSTATESDAPSSSSPPDVPAELAAFWDEVYQALETHKALTPRLKEMFARQAPPEPAAVDKAVSSPPPRNGGGDRRIVDRRAARVFRALFHDPTATPIGGNSTPATLTWPDVVHVMKAAGFSAERLYASAWLFLPGPIAKAAAVMAAAKGHGSGNVAAARRSGTTTTQPRPSLFHEPWGSTNESGNTAKLTPAEARWIGKRLNRAYGWDATTFASE